MSPKPLRSTKQLSVTLPDEITNAVKAKVQSGEYATESKVIHDGLRVLLASDSTIESWLNDQVGQSYDALGANPSSAVTADEVRQHLAAEHSKGR
jgi:putative addiction module CopG family antidote